MVYSFTGLAQLALIRQGPESVGRAEPNEWHGWSVALGDFNGDGYADLATGAPLEGGGADESTAGVVVINPGSAHGLTWTGAYSLSPIDGSLDPDRDHLMGYALAVGDFNGDGYDDLAVGLPASPVGGILGFVNAGRVLVYYGGPGGLPGTASVILSGSFGLRSANGDLFGLALAAGRLGNDEYDDLAIGAPGRNGGRGAVFVVRGGPQGLNTAAGQVLTGADFDPLNREGDRFGTAVAIGNIIGFPAGELIVGAPLASLTAAAPSSGIVYIANSSDGSVATANVLRVTALDFGDELTTHGRFGAALCVGDFWGDGATRDLAIGAPGNRLGGRVYVGRGTPIGIAWSVILRQNDADEPDDLFGAALAAGDHNGSGYDDLAVGSPGEDFELAFFGDETGAVHIFNGGPDGPSQEDVTTWWTVDLGDQAYQSARLGYSLAAGRTSASARHSFVAGAPIRDDRRGQVFDIAPWRQVPRLLCRSATAADCEGNIVYALRPFERVKIASTTKIMTVLLGAEATTRAVGDPLRVALDAPYLIEPWMYDAFPLTSGCSIYGFTPLPDFLSESVTFEDLLYGCIMVSGNDSAYAIADAMTGEIDDWSGLATTATEFAALMNERAAGIGMTDTFFTNPAGVDSGDPYSTARDMWLLAREAMANPIVREIVNTTRYTADKMMPGFEVGLFNIVPVTISYSWLNRLKNLDRRIIGLKPGGTPGARSTGVVAARFDAAGERLAYANGFGWDDAGYGWVKLAALARLGLSFCNVDLDTPAGFALAPASTGNSPISRAIFNYNHFNNAPMQGVEFGSFDEGEPGPTSIRGFPLLNGGDLNEMPALPMTWDYRALWVMSPGDRAGVRIRPVVGGKVRLHLPFDRGSAPPASGRLLLSGTFHDWTVGPVALPPGTDFFPPEWDEFEIPAGLAEFAIENMGDETIVLAFDARFDLELVFAVGSDEPFHAELEPLMGSTRSGHVLLPGAYDGEEAFDVELIVESRKHGTAYLPSMKITRMDRRPVGSGETEQVAVEFETEDWDQALDPFIEEFVIESAESVESSNWQALGRITAGKSSGYLWEDELPQAQTRYLRVRSVPQSGD
jgi:hypothetical protein